MIVIPAIDIKGGRCVRLRQGRMDEETVYSEDPVEVARRWAGAGAELIHLVDLDAAIEGTPVNFDTIAAIATEVSTPLQIGGGIRDTVSAERYLAIKTVKRIIIGTAALENPPFVAELATKYPGRVAVGIDAKDGFVAIKGWVEVTDSEAASIAKGLEGAGISCIIYTDISRDGMLTGPNIEATKKIADSINIPVVASGGVSKIDDIVALKEAGVEGVIVGKALYSGDVELKDAIARAGG